MLGCPEQSIRIYLKQAQKYKLLTREEESKLIIEYRGGCVKAYQQLVAANCRFVYSIALKYRTSGASLADLVQEGSLGLIDALGRYKPESECRLLTLAVWYIKEYIRRCVVRHYSIVKNDSHDLRIQLFAKDKSMQKKSVKSDHSLNVQAGQDNDKTYLDLLEGDVSNPETQLGEEQKKIKLKALVDAALAKLNDAERHVIRQRIMVDDEKTLQELGTQKNVSRERIRQIEERAINKLKTYLPYDSLLDLVA